MKYFLMANLCFMLAVLVVMVWILYEILHLKQNRKEVSKIEEDRQATEILYETSSLTEEGETFA